MYFMQNNDGDFVLSILLGAVFIISFIWLASGIRQYRSISPWSKGYDEYKKENKEMDRKLSDWISKVVLSLKLEKKSLFPINFIYIIFVQYYLLRTTSTIFFCLSASSVSLFCAST